ncbi:dual serine/threonine and tyrosine protein kinase-like [Battus philenor]|uniref:dual serine/threonine and tyrosine protein kinase-like n=1 Tax=Battus philenor TaxID=42288 RepID=UPI0035CFC746
MAGPWRRAAARARLLRGLLRDTEKALHDVADVLSYDPEIGAIVQEIRNLSSRPTALVILGTTPTARARLLHCLLGRRLLPEPLPRGCRWLRVQYGTSTQVHLTFGNSEFELVEDLECNQKPWETLPLQDLLRQDQSDQVTMLEIEINNPLLKDGLRIIVPPDIATPPDGASYLQLKQMHSDLFNKRHSILQTYAPIYMYAIDRTGRNIFSDNISSTRIVARTEDDFWSTFNLYYMTRTGGGGERTNVEDHRCADENEVKEGNGEAAVFTPENCLDIHQIKELDPNSQVFFVLFSDSVDVLAEENRRNQEVDERLHLCVEATESTEDWFNTEDLPESDQGLLQDGILRREEMSPEQNGGLNRRLHEAQIAFMNELIDQWELIFRPPPKHQAKSQWAILDDLEILRTAEQKANAANSSDGHGGSGETLGRRRRGESDRAVKNRPTFLNSVLRFATDCAQSYLLDYCTRLSEVHVKLLQQFILASFDMARELQVVPKKIQYVARQEHQLYEVMSAKFSEGEKKQELVQIMQDVLQEMRCEIDNMDWSVDDLPCHQDKRYILSNSIFYSSRSSPTVSLVLSDRKRAERPVPTDPSPSEPASPSDVEEAVSYDSYNFDDYEIIHSNDESLGVSECYTRIKARPDDTASLISQIGMIKVENESEAFSLSGSGRGWGTTLDTNSTTATTCTNNANMSIKQASLDVQQTVLSKLSRMISLKLVDFVDCLKDTYFGTLQRCLQSLESSCKQELGGRPASEAMRQLLSVARQVDLQPCASFSLLRSLLESLRRFFYKLRIVGGEGEDACCVLSPVWRRQVALHTIHSLSPQRLARIISGQILERLSVAHETYQSALTSLETALANRLHHTEDVKLAIRKKYAPSFARLCLESTSMCDLLMYGTPELGREIGRGQYGVVYAARSWAGHSPVAVKSVLPADERHYHELAMEFFYTRSIPEHPRVVRLLGSLVQRGAGAAPGVLLVSSRLARDLYAAVRAGLTFATRMRIACDIVDGIRYLHSLGLVHRDVKMKNVLLDHRERAALSDLGFCAAEALISGSVVGTPVHMAPELLNGEYDAAVDVYAFGILFWYVCAGNIKLPAAFEAFQNKEQLWSKVKRGLRPERLPHFSDECWEVMESCWASEPSQRALLGDVQPKLERILEKALKEQGNELYAPKNRARKVSEDESLDMTGIHNDA